MNFNWTPTTDQNIYHKDLIDTRFNYKKITEEFCKTYYTKYDNNFSELCGMYKPESLFTYLDEEITGFQQFLTRLNQYNIHKFKHHKIHVNAQPIGQRSVMLVVTGTISVNDSIYVQKFTETLFLQRDDNNKFFIYHSIFKLTD